MARHDLGRVVHRLEAPLGRGNHALDGAVAAPVEIGIVPATERVVGREHIGVGEIGPAVTVGRGMTDSATLQHCALDGGAIGIKLRTLSTPAASCRRRNIDDGRRHRPLPPTYDRLWRVERAGCARAAPRQGPYRSALIGSGENSVP